MLRFLRCALLCLLCASASARADERAAEREKTVRTFVAAFNAKDPEAMSRLVTDDVEWMSIHNDQVHVETRGKAALQTAMSNYFAQCPTCRSELKHCMATRYRVSALEVASWRGKDGPTQQSSFSVYEFSGHRIRRVYYFPAEK
jgi:hypothetical protein